MYVYYHTTPNPEIFPSGSVKYKMAKAQLDKELDELTFLYWEHRRDAKRFRRFSILFSFITAIGFILLALVCFWG